MEYAMAGEKWTREEDAWLRQNYPTASWDHMPARLKRSEGGIDMRARRLGLRRARRPRPEPSFPPKLVRDVTRLYAVLTAPEIARRHRTSERRVRDVVRWLGLTKAHARNPRLVRRIRKLAWRRSYREVAMACEVSRGCVAGILRDYGRAP